MAGMVTAMRRADAALTIDADLQDDPDAIDAMVDKWLAGAEIVCGVRDRRDTDTFFKRFTARAFYILVRLGGAKTIFDHADFRLMSAAAIKKLCCFGTEDLFLRGLVTRLGLPLEIVKYDRRARLAGESKYTLKKMLKLAFDGITGFSQKPLVLPAEIGIGILALGGLGLIALIVLACTVGIPGWLWGLDAVVLLDGIILCFMGVQGMYFGRMYDELQGRPLYIVGESIHDGE